MCIIYDDEVALPDGRLRFEEWKYKINSEIVTGSRIMIEGNIAERIFRSLRREGWGYLASRYLKTYNSEYSAPGIPSTNVYEVKNIIEESYYYGSGIKESLVIKFKGNLEERWWTEERKHLYFSFKVFANDEFVLNYDEISIEDCEFYIKSRVDRKNYLDMLPILYTIRKLRIEELNKENEFVKMLKSDFPSIEDSIILEHIEWWKYKNKYKRGLNKDDAKAFRMISRKLNKI